MTAFQSIMLLSVGAPLTPTGGSSWSLQKVKIDDIFSPNLWAKKAVTFWNLSLNGALQGLTCCVSLTIFVERWNSRWFWAIEKSVRIKNVLLVDTGFGSKKKLKVLKAELWKKRPTYSPSVIKVISYSNGFFSNSVAFQGSKSLATRSRFFFFMRIFGNSL